MRLVWDENAWEDYLWWQAQDRKTLRRINLLIRDIVRNGNEGIGKPEPLKHDFAGYWSRRIDDEHRLVYKLVGDEVVFFKDGLSLKDCKGEDTMLIFCRYNEGETIERGKRILKIMKLGRTMNDGDLNMKTQYLVRAVKKTFGIPG